MKSNETADTVSTSLTQNLFQKLPDEMCNCIVSFLFSETPSMQKLIENSRYKEERIQACLLQSVSHSFYKQIGSVLDEFWWRLLMCICGITNVNQVPKPLVEFREKLLKFGIKRGMCKVLNALKLDKDTVDLLIVVLGMSMFFST